MVTIKPLTGKFYGTKIIDSEGDTILTLWVGFKNYLPEEVSPREIANNWSHADQGFDHVESIYDLAAAEAVVTALNNINY